jgi:hypothetical protein
MGYALGGAEDLLIFRNRAGAHSDVVVTDARYELLLYHNQKYCCTLYYTHMQITECLRLNIVGWLVGWSVLVVL